MSLCSMENSVTSPKNSSEPLSPLTKNCDQFSEQSVSVMDGLAVVNEVNNMHFHSADSQQQQQQQHNDWNPTSTVVGAPPSVESIDSKRVPSPTDLDNNNLSKQRNTSPLNQQHTVSAAADSSDTQNQQQQSRVSPQPEQVRHPQSHFPTSYDTMPYGNQAQLQQPLPSMSSMHPNADMQYSFMHSYDPYYHSMDYGPPAPFPQHMHHQSMHDYKPVPSSRFQPYPSHLAPTASVSPRIVSSSGSPSMNHSPMISGHQQVPPPGQPTPSPSPKQCGKCTFVCETSNQLNDHYNSMHNSASDVDPNQQMQNNRSGSGDENNMPNFQYQQNQQYSTTPIKEEPNADILDLDSHKMVYPPGADGGSNQPQQHHVPLPSMQSLQPQRNMIWSAEHHTFLSDADMKQAYNSPTSMMIKSEYPISPPSKQQQSEYGHQSHQMAHHQDGSLGATKSFASDVSSVGNHLPTSPSEFPSTTTPGQGMGPAFALDSNDKQSPNWKSNEARRPKTYNCTACNKWFTSSGHLKRHYNTTLHKNAVKSSGQVDPATMPINMHHHPHRDQNKLHNRRSPAQSAPHVPPEPPSSPDYGAASSVGSQQQQFSPPLGFPQGYQQQHQQFENAPQNHPNGQAGPSVPASQTRGLLIFATNMGTQQQQQEQLGNDLYQQQQQEQQELSQHNSMDMLVLDHLQQQPQQHLTSMDQLEDQHQHLLLLQQDPSQPMDQQHIFMPISTISNSSNIPMPTNNSSPQHSLHQLQPLQPSNTISLAQYHHHLPPTTTIQLHPHHQLHHSPTESMHTISPSSSTTTTTTTSNIITITNPHSYQAPAEGIIQLQAPSLEHHQHQQPIYHTITGNHLQLTQNDTEMIELADLSSNANLLFGNVYNDMENQENMDPVYSMVNYSRMQPGGVAPQFANASAPHSPDTAETYQPNNSPAQSAQLIKYSTSPILAQAAVPLTPSPPPAPGGSIPVDAQTKLTPTAGKPNVISPYGMATLSNNNKNNQRAPNTNPTATKPRAKTTPANAKPRAKASASTSPDLAANGPHRCEECDKVFNKACYLTQHNKTFHSGEKPFKCQRCGKRFPCIETHQVHFEKHAGEKPFKCKLCPKQFNHKTDLRRHLCLHSGKKPYACEECGKQFIRKDHMMKHVETHRRKEEMMLAKMNAMQEKMRVINLERKTRLVGRRPAALKAPRQPLAMLKQLQAEKLLVKNEMER